MTACLSRILLPMLFFVQLVRAQNEPARQNEPVPPVNEQRRVLVLTDIENEPDDAQSMVRFLTYSNQWKVEGLIATTSVHQKEETAAWRIREIVDAYGEVRENLLLHEPGYPETDYLRSIIKEGYPGFGMSAVGAGKDSEGSDWIIEVVDREDERPVWVTVWGGANCLAQALWKVKMTRSPQELKEFVSRLRVYTVSDQDDTGPWLRETFPELFYIASPGYHAAGAYHYATWTGISGDRFHGRFAGADFSIVDNPWLDENVRQGHGPLGAQYPQTEFLMEGDTPTFMFLIENGLNAPEHPDYGGWGGRYEYYTPRMQKWFYQPETRPFWTNAMDEVQGIDGRFYTGNKATIWRWREAYQHDFAARMDWCVSSYEEANHPPQAALGHSSNITVKSGAEVQLSAAGSTDPDGDELTYRWIYYHEAGSYAFKDPIELRGGDRKEVSFTAPQVSSPKTIHVVLAVSDNGKPALTRYQRVIVSVIP